MSASASELILTVTGVLTATLIAGAIFPRPVLKVLFGVSDADWITVLLARYAFLLVGLVGLFLVYAAGHPEARVPALVAGIVEKLFLAVLVFGAPLRRRAATMAAVTADLVMVVLFALILR